MSGVRIVPFERKHLKEAVDIHVRAFPGFFLTFLGPGFLRVFYGSFAGDKAAICRVAIDESTGSLLGAAFGIESPAGFFLRLAKKKWWAFGLAALRAVVLKPSIAGRVIRGLSYRGDPPPHPGYALLSSIAVSPEAQGRGVGRALLDAWAGEAKQRGRPGAYLATDAERNDPVNRFYVRSGWAPDGSFTTREGRRMNIYSIGFAGAE